MARRCAPWALRCLGMALLWSLARHEAARPLAGAAARCFGGAPRRAAGRPRRAALRASVALSGEVHGPRGSGEPHVVLLHGLDSWRGAFRPAMEALAERGLPSVALDLRGHGESPLGEPEDFSPGQLALDVREALVREGVVPEEGGAGGPGIVLLGHSMGGRVAARYAADHPRDLAALVLADIDCQLLKEGQVHRPGMSKRKALFVSGEVSPRAEERFRHGFASWKELKAALVSSGFAGHRVNYWRKEPHARLFERPEGGEWWSGVSPDAQRLVRDRIINSTDAADALQELAALGEGGVAVWFWLAAPQWTVCNMDGPLGIRWMQSAVPSSQVEVFNASHALHKAAPDAFVDALEGLARESAKAQK